MKLFEVLLENGKRLYANSFGYIHCHHENCKLLPVVYMWGNTSYICEKCGEVVKKDLMPTS